MQGGEKNKTIIKKKQKGFCSLHLEGPLYNNKGLCSKMISLKTFLRFLTVTAVGCLATR